LGRISISRSADGSDSGRLIERDRRSLFGSCGSSSPPAGKRGISQSELTRYLGTLIGLTLLSHQVGAFFGAWLGGLALERFGNFTWMWYADIVLALAAVAANLPIREARVVLRPAAATA